MKKVGIITLNGNDNYGNKLQHYAVQTILEKYNLKAETIRCIYNTNYFMYYLKHFIKIFLKKRYRAFLHFDKMIKYYKNNIYYTNNSKIKSKLNDKFDYFVVGSDQVWNSSLNCFNDIFLLSFAEKEKRISFSASFGISELKNSSKKVFEKELPNFKSISVREDKGKEIIEELIDRNDVEVLTDPTMLITANEWNKISRKPSMLKNDKYILTYFLGELSIERKAEIERIAKENGCEIINILDNNSPFYICGPSEFLYLEKNAFLICTDSFHSSVFAILYDRPFIVFDREQDGVQNINSRIDTLINKFKLENRRFKGNITVENLKHNYSEAYKILAEERKKSNKFLEKALDIEK